MKTYIIDLSKPQFERWQEMAISESNSIKIIVSKIKEDLLLNGITGFIIKKLLHAIYLTFKWPYYKELIGISFYSGINIDDLILLNLSHELDYLSKIIIGISKLSNIFFCTSVAITTENGILIGRNFDFKYNTTEIKNNICRFVFKRIDNKEYECISYPGFIGINTGIIRKRFGIVFNSAPLVGIPNPNYMQPSIVIRKILENYDDFEEAQYILNEQFLCCSGIFVLFDKYRISILERTKDLSVEMCVDKAVICNHFISNELERYNANSVESKSRSKIASSMIKQIERPTCAFIASIMHKVSIDHTIYKSIITSDYINIIN